MSFIAAQCRAARALLNWSQADLANASKVATKTIADFEREDRSPYQRTLADIQGAIESAGVEFTNGAQPGVRMKSWKQGDKARLRRASERHASTFGIGAGEVAAVDDWRIVPGDPPWGRFRLRLSSGALTAWLETSNFERVN
jgi:transcriptional regulator with XRE-family HTH domain